MMRIENNEDLRVAYKDLIAWEKEISGSRYRSILDEIIEEYKIEIRAYFKRTEHKTAKLVQFDSDNEIWLEELPETIKTIEEAKVWFSKHRYREKLPYYYNCSGQLFTAWHKIFKRNGKYFAYHCICRDV